MSHYLDVLTPQNSQLIFIAQQPQLAYGVHSIDRQVLKNNVDGLAKAAKLINIPPTKTTVETDGFSGNTYPELLAVFPEKQNSGTYFHELMGGPKRPRCPGGKWS